MAVAMASHVRHPISIAIVLLAVAATAGVFAFARPEYHPLDGVSINLPAKQPATDTSGAAGWVWPDGTPGWEAGQTIKGINVSGVQPIEIQAAQLAAARNGLDASKVRVLDSLRPSTAGALAILAAPTLGETPVRTCLAAVLPGDAPVRWRCPGSTPSPDDLARSPVLLAATGVDWGPRVKGNVLFFVGVARGDVNRVVLHARGLLASQTIYTRGRTWGQFDMAVTTAGSRVRLEIFGTRKHLETLMLNAAPGQQRIFP
jgi:hypothetical protein